MTRFRKLQAYINKMARKEAYIRLTEIIAQVSETSGIPQWELRARVEKDFGIDI